MKKIPPSKIFTYIQSLHLPETTEKKCDGFYIQKPENIHYLSGFTGSFGRILLSKKKAFLISDSRYSSSAQRFADIFGLEYRELISGKKGKNFWKNLEKEAEISLLGFESHNCTYQQFENLQKIFCSPLVDLPDIIEHFREQKSKEEILLIQKAAQIADKALLKVTEHFTRGITEKELAWIFEEEARKNLGAEELSFHTIVAFGKNSSIPHHFPSEKKLEENMPILIDCGVKFSGYCSDMTRCFWFGEEKGENFLEWKRVYEKVFLAQQKGIEHMKKGESFSSADFFAREFFKEEEPFFIHAFGHGVGLEIHEFPILRKQSSSGKILENMVITAEPGLYFPGKFGIRIEDLFVVTKTKVKKLSQFPYYKI